MNRFNTYNWSASTGDYHSSAEEYIKLSIVNKKKALMEKALISITIVGCLAAVFLIILAY